MSTRLLPLVAVSALALGCAVPPPQPAARPATPSPSASALPAGAIRFAITSEGSLATVRVREQIAGVPLPGEAVLTTDALSGELVLLADGTFAVGSTIAVDLDTLHSDSALRDEWIKVNTLETGRYRQATFTAMSIAGIPLPLPAAGTWEAQLHGTMRIRDRERALAWDLMVTRSADEVRARGAITFAFGDYGMAVPANRMILSVVDEVRLTIDVRAAETGRG